MKYKFGDKIVLKKGLRQTKQNHEVFSVWDKSRYPYAVVIDHEKQIVQFMIQTKHHLCGRELYEDEIEYYEDPNIFTDIEKDDLIRINPMYASLYKEHRINQTYRVIDAEKYSIMTSAEREHLVKAHVILANPKHKKPKYWYQDEDGMHTIYAKWYSDTDIEIASIANNIPNAEKIARDILTSLRQQDKQPN